MNSLNKLTKMVGVTIGWIVYSIPLYLYVVYMHIFYTIIWGDRLSYTDVFIYPLLTVLSIYTVPMAIFEYLPMPNSVIIRVLIYLILVKVSLCVLSFITVCLF